MSSFGRVNRLHLCRRIAKKVRTLKTSSLPETLELSDIQSQLITELDSISIEAPGSGHFDKTMASPRTTVSAMTDQDFVEAEEYAQQSIHNSESEPSAEEYLERHRNLVQSFLDQPLKHPYQGQQVDTKPPRKWTQLDLAFANGFGPFLSGIRQSKSEKMTEASLAQDVQTANEEMQETGALPSSHALGSSVTPKGKRREQERDHVMSIDGPVYAIYNLSQAARRSAPQHPNAWIKGYVDRIPGLSVPEVASQYERLTHEGRVLKMHGVHSAKVNEAGNAPGAAFNQRLGGGFLSPSVKRKMDGNPIDEIYQSLHTQSRQTKDKDIPRSAPDEPKQKRAIDNQELTPDQIKSKKRKVDNSNMRKDLLLRNQRSALFSSKNHHISQSGPVLANPTPGRRRSSVPSPPSMTKLSPAPRSVTPFAIPQGAGLAAAPCSLPGSSFRPTQHEEMAHFADGSKDYDSHEPAGACGVERMRMTQKHSLEVIERARTKYNIGAPTGFPLSNGEPEKLGKLGRGRQEHARASTAMAQYGGMGHGAGNMGETQDSRSAAAVASSATGSASYTSPIVPQPGLQNYQSTDGFAATRSQAMGLQYKASIIDRTNTFQYTTTARLQNSPTVPGPRIPGGNKAVTNTSNAPDASESENVHRSSPENVLATPSTPIATQQTAAPTPSPLPPPPQTPGLQPHHPTPTHSSIDPLRLPSCEPHIIYQQNRQLIYNMPAGLSLQTGPMNKTFDFYPNQNFSMGLGPQVQTPTPAPSPDTANAIPRGSGMGGLRGGGIMDGFGGQGMETKDLSAVWGGKGKW